MYLSLLSVWPLCCSFLYHSICERCNHNHHNILSFILLALPFHPLSINSSSLFSHHLHLYLFPFISPFRPLTLQLTCTLSETLCKTPYFYSSVGFSFPLCLISFFWPPLVFSPDVTCNFLFIYFQNFFIFRLSMYLPFHSRTIDMQPGCLLHLVCPNLPPVTESEGCMIKIN